jgi:tetratricopeptide (TPR) repeat protein
LIIAEFSRHAAMEAKMNVLRKGLLSGLAIAGLCSMLLSAPCLAAGGADDPLALQDPDYVAGKKAIDAKDWNAAVKSFTVAAEHAPKNADIQNYLGYANRKLGNYDLAFRHYGMALDLNPNHRGAHEYVGETYLLVNDPAKAEEHLAALAKLCFVPCAEYNDLKRAIAAYKDNGGKAAAAAGDKAY